MDLIIYQNEAYLLGDEIKKRFRQKYKHFNVRVYYHIENEILKGIDIEIIEPLLHLRRSRMISVNGFFKVSDFIEYIIITASDLVEEILKSYYTI